MTFKDKDNFSEGSFAPRAMTSQLNDRLKAIIEQHMKEYGYRANEIYATLTIDCGDIIAGKPVTVSAVTLNGHNYSYGVDEPPNTVLASITFAASDFPPEEDFEFCAGDSGCDCGCGEYDGVDPDALLRMEGHETAIDNGERLPDASDFMRQALSGELFGFTPYDADEERAKQAAYNEALARFDLLDPPRVYSYPLVLGYAPGGYFDTAANKWVGGTPTPSQMRVHDLYVSVNGKTEIAIASNYPPGTIIQSVVGNWFKGDGTMWQVTSERPTEPAEAKPAYSGPIIQDAEAIGARLKSIEPKYVTPKPPAEKLDVWAKGTARRNDGWLWRWSGVEWKKEGPAF